METPSNIIPEPNKNEQFVRSYVTSTKALVESYSPQILKQSVNTFAAWTPEPVATRVVDALKQTEELLDGYIDATDEFLEVAIEQTSQFPELLNQYKQKFLSGETLQNVTTKTAIFSYLPSQYVDDLDVQSRVQEIIGFVVSQPQFLKDKANEVGNHLDVDKDGKISVTDLAGNLLETTQIALAYCTALIPAIPETVSSSFGNVVTMFLDSKTTKPIIADIRNKLEKSAAVNQAFQFLWNGADALKEFVSQYSLNIQSKYEPLSPYIVNLISKTSVIELPFEILKLLQTTVGLSDDKETVAVVSETHALFWALLDISFLVEVLKQDSVPGENDGFVEGEKEEFIEGEETENDESMELIDDSDAVKDMGWAKGLGGAIL